MAKEAEAHAEEDKAKKEQVEARNMLDSAVYQAEKLQKDNGDKLSDDDKKTLTEAVEGFPGGHAWRTAIEAVPEATRHLAVHEGHLVALNERDRTAIRDLAPLMTAFGVSGNAKEVRGKVDAMAATGVTEVAYQPSGPDIPRELRAFIDAVG